MTSSGTAITFAAESWPLPYGPDARREPGLVVTKHPAPSRSPTRAMPCPVRTSDAAMKTVSTATSAI
jgi:hypothetical protein